MLAVASADLAFAQVEAPGPDNAASIVIRVSAQQPAARVPADTPPLQQHQPAARSLRSALRLARTLRRQSAEPVPIVIELSAGVHRLAEAVSIGPEDSGSQSSPLIIRGASSGETTLRGSVPLTPAAASDFSGLPLSKLSAAARAAVKVYELPPEARSAQHVDVARIHDREPGLLPFEIFDASGPLHPARWPNEGYASGASITAAEGGTRFTLSDAPLVDWAGEPDLWVNGNFRWHWNYETKRIARVLPPKQSIELETPPQFGFGSDPVRVFVSHTLSELDTPGEWYRHQNTGTLIVWPRGGARPEIEVSVAPHLIELRDATHVRIENLTLERVRGSAVTVRGGAHVAISGVKIRHTGGVAVRFDGARDSGIENCDINGTGEGGVRLAGGDRPSLTRADLYVRNCRIEDFSRLGRMYRPAIHLEGVGNIAHGNYISDAPHTAIWFAGNDHLIELNEITRVLTDTTDAGAVDTGRDWTARGTIIRNNFLHDLRGSRGGYEVKGIYLDDFTSGVMVEGNVFLRVEQPMFIGGGRDNTVRGNLMIGSEPGIHIDGRGLTWNGELVWNTDRELRTRLDAMPIASSHWAKRYPELTNILADEPARAKRNRVEGNLFVSGVPYRIYPEVELSEQDLQAPLTPSALGIAEPADLASRIGKLQRARDIPSVLGNDLLRAGGLAPLPFSKMDRSTILPLPVPRPQGR